MSVLISSKPDHQDVAGEHRYYKQKHCDTSVKPRHSSEKKQQERDTASDNHPQGMVDHLLMITASY